MSATSRRPATRFNLSAFPAKLAGPSGTELTPIAALNRRIYDMVMHRNRLDEAHLCAPPGPVQNAAYMAFDATLEPIFALYDEVRDLPAQTLEDATVKATIALYYADRLHGANLDDAGVKDVASDLLTLLSSIILEMVKVGGLDIDRLGWGEVRGICALHAPGAEGVA